MREISFLENKFEKCVIALGFFDAVHIGHECVLSECVLQAKEMHVTPFAFTFDNNPCTYVKQKTERLISSFDERLKRFSSIGIEAVLSAPCEESFFELTPIQFLEKLKAFGALGIVCGRDYTFGAGGKGDVFTLEQYCSKNDIKLFVVNEKQVNDNKVSSSTIKDLIKTGDINQANKLLGYNYSISGTVIKGRGDGGKYLFPTMNLSLPNEKVLPKTGVYYTKAKIDDKTYKSITNVGAHPTFNDVTENIETYVLDFTGDLYGKHVEIEFIDYLREIKKFDSVDDLKAQISHDIALVRSKV